jgi:Endosomal/lysosomal potassium channel TMEM175
MPSPMSRERVASLMPWLRSFATARAPGGMAGHDSPAVHRTPGRLVAFSDAVFAIAITLLVLEIKLPADYTHLLHELLALWPSYLAYALTFLLIGQVWANHHVMFDQIRVADRVILLLNTLLLLMIVAFLPFATSVLDIQRRLAVRAPPPAAQQNPRRGGRGGHRQAISAGPGLAHDRRPARPSDTAPRRSRDRCIQRLLLAPDPG